MADPQVIDYRFRVRRGSAAAWTADNGVLLDGEFGLESDTRKLKMGDGATPWNNLKYQSTVEGINRQLGSLYTLALSDVNATVICANAAWFTLTVPTNAVVPIDVGSKIAYSQGLAGPVTIAAAAGVTIHAPNGLVTGAQFDGGVLEKIDTDEWILWNGPMLATVATTGSYNDLANKPYLGTITAANEQAGTAYTLALSDIGKMVRMSNAAPSTLAIPPNGTVNLPLYTPIPIFQGGVGAVTIVAGTGVTLESPNGVSTTGNGDFRVIFQRATDIWAIA